ncbi:MAG: hypothetical protein ACRD41_03660, partial [Candidatus Acidiferrales bacterium]
KLHPIFNMAAEMVQNKDFYGTQIVDPDANIPAESKQFLMYLGKSFLPYAVQGASRNSATGASTVGNVAPFLGITPSPGDITRSKFQDYVANKYFDNLPQGARSQEKADESAKFNLAVQVKRSGGTPDVSSFTPSQRMKLAKLAHTTVPQIRFKRLSLPEKLQAYDMATPEERQQYKLKAAILGSGWNRYINAQQDPAEKDQLRKQISALR